MGKGNIRCPACNGTGVVRVSRGFVPCRCVRGSKESRTANSRLQSPDGATSALEAVARLRKRYDS